ncbi:hypothetical protein C4553_03800 [Candidatus Parcubacteria bacterium]|nr:MAG: hypothetical protein C4553_03800 [Candidatus Parcubacteria bacterium]
MKTRLAIVISLVIIFLTLLTYFLIYGLDPEKTSQKDETLSFAITPTAILSHEHPGGADPVEHAIFINTPIEIKEDIFITGFEPIINGAPSEIIHHGILIDANDKDFICPKLPKTFFAFGGELTALSFPKEYGLKLNKSDNLILQIMFHNPGKIDYADVIAGINLKYKSVDSSLKELEPIVINAAGCNGNWQFTVPPKQTEFTKKSGISFKPKEPVELIIGGAHLHKYGLGLKALINDLPTKDFVPEYDSLENLIKIGVWSEPKLVITNNDAITTETVYENPTMYPILDAMGTLILYASPAENFTCDISGFCFKK